MYIMFRSVLFLATFEIAFSSSADLPGTCTDDPPCPIDQPNRIPWTECGGYLPMCDIARCCTDKEITVTDWDKDASEKVLESEDIHVDAFAAGNRSLLMLTAIIEYADIVKKLIARAASVNLHDKNGVTALMFASRAGSANIMKMLLDAKASTGIVSDYGWNAMTFANTYGRIEATGLLLDYCTKAGVDEKVKKLGRKVDGKANIVDGATKNTLKKRLSQAQNNPLIAAVLRGSENGTRRIVQNPDACMNGRSFNDTVDGMTALEHARNMNREDMENILLEQYATLGRELIRAASEGDLDIGKKLVAQGLDVAAMNNAIVAAVENDRASFVDFLLENGASADARNSNNEPVLYIAAKKNNTDIVLRLVKSNASNSLTSCLNSSAQPTTCDAETKACDTALTVAMRNGYMRVVEHLTRENREGIDQVFCAGSRRYSSLTWASERGEAQIVSRLLSEGCVDISFQTGGKSSLEIAQDDDIIRQLEAAQWPYITAIQADDLQADDFKLISFEDDACKRSHVNEKKDGKSLLMFAVDLEKKDIVDELIQKADVNAQNNDGQTALMLAAKKNNTIVKSLLQSSEIEVNAVNNNGTSALMITAANCSRDNVQSFLVHDKIEVDAIDAKKQTALMHAVRCSAEIVRALLNHGANVGARGDEDRTALMQAVDYCNAPVVSVLLKYDNANLCNMRYLDSETALMHAVKKCEVDVVNHLVNHSSIQINAKKLAATALMIAVEKNRSLDIITSLLRHPDVSVAPTKRKNDSPLVRAVVKNRTDIVESLLLANADPEVEYNETLTVLGTAVQKNVNVKIVELLLEYNATVDHRFMRGLSMTDRNSEIVRVIQDARWPLLKKIENRISGLSIKNEMIPMRHRKSKMELDECMGFFEPKTMWMTAAQANNTDAMEQLLRLDTKHRYIDRTCDTGYTPLCIAATKNHVEIAKLLLNECPNLDLRCDKRNYDLGISFDKMNTYGNSALEIAKEKGFSDIAEEIRYKKWILLGKIARNESKSVEELRKEYLEGGHKCDITIAKRSYVIDPEEKCDRNETVEDWVIRYGQENILEEISAVFPSVTLFGLRNATIYGQKIVQGSNATIFIGFFGFLIIPLGCLLYSIINCQRTGGDV